MRSEAFYVNEKFQRRQLGYKMLALACIFEHLDWISYRMSRSNPPSQFCNRDKVLQNHPTTTSEHTSTDHILDTNHVLSAFGHHIQIDIHVILPLSLNNISCFLKVWHPRCVRSIMQSCSVYISIYIYSHETQQLYIISSNI